MSTMITKAQHVFRSRPYLSITATSIASLTSYAYFIEYETDVQTKEYLLHQSKKSNDDGDNGQNHYKYMLPTNYNRNALLTYWNHRPISVMTRLCTILYEVLPFAFSYTKDFYIQPFLSSWFRDNDENDENKIQRIKLQTIYAQELRSILTKLGPAFIKLGQQLSIRPDLLPSHVLFELQRLCDQVTPVSDEIAKRVLEKEFNGLIRIINNDHDDVEIQQRYDDNDIIWIKDFKLVASASLGQVYKATRVQSKQNNPRQQQTEDKEIAIKIQRPEMKDKVSLDLYLLNNYGSFLDCIFGIITNQIPFHQSFINCFAHGSYNELDYVKEGCNQTYLKNELAKRGMTSDVVYIPNVYEEMTSEKVITMDWVDGMKLANANAKDVQKLIPIGVELFLTQLLDIGFFHSDPHPGNLYVIQKSNKNDQNTTPILCLLDFGLCAEIDSQSRLAMTTAIVHLLNGDYDTLINKDAKNLGFLPHELDISKTDIQPILTKILKEGLLESKSNLVDRKRNLMSISNELNHVFFKYPFSVPPFFALITRGLGLLEGIALSGDPNFDIFQASYPYASKRAAEIYGKHSWSWFKSSLKDIGSFGKGREME